MSHREYMSPGDGQTIIDLIDEKVVITQSGLEFNVKNAFSGMDYHEKRAAIHLISRDIDNKFKHEGFQIDKENIDDVNIYIKFEGHYPSNVKSTIFYMVKNIWKNIMGVCD